MALDDMQELRRDLVMRLAGYDSNAGTVILEADKLLDFIMRGSVPQGPVKREAVTSADAAMGLLVGRGHGFGGAAGPGSFDELGARSVIAVGAAPTGYGPGGGDGTARGILAGSGGASGGGGATARRPAVSIGGGFPVPQSRLEG